jgi:hypothetical protein
MEKNSLGNDRDDERILETRPLKVCRAVIEDEIDSSELLESLETTAGTKSFADGALKAVDIGAFANAHLVSVVGFDLAELLDQAWVVLRKTSESTERFGGLVVLVLFDLGSVS